MSKKEIIDVEKPQEAVGLGLAKEDEPPADKSKAVKALKAPKTFRFRDTNYVLTELTEEQKEYLRQFPEQVPYLGE